MSIKNWHYKKYILLNGRVMFTYEDILTAIPVWYKDGEYKTIPYETKDCSRPFTISENEFYFSKILKHVKYESLEVVNDEKALITCTVPLWCMKKTERAIRFTEISNLQHNPQFYNKNNVMISRKDMAEAWKLYRRVILDIRCISHNIYDYDNDNFPGTKWTHFPFKDVSQNSSGNFSYALNPENWNLPEREIEVVQRCMGEIYEYASKMYQFFPKGTYIPTEFVITPEYLFRWYNPRSIAWRMGPGEGYAEWFHEKYQSLSGKEKTLVDKWYPMPKVYTERF